MIVVSRIQKTHTISHIEELLFCCCWMGLVEVKDLKLDGHANRYCQAKMYSCSHFIVCAMLMNVNNCVFLGLGLLPSESQTQSCDCQGTNMRSVSLSRDS